ncbi:MAG: NUDIX hydrolase [Caldilineaceae bacterium]
MDITLACTWRPRGEMTRFHQLRPQLAQHYTQIILVTPATAGEEAVATVCALADEPHLTVVISPAPPASRYLALQTAYQHSAASHIHYADLDRLLHWVETRPAEWGQTVADLPNHECLVIGRTAQAFATHPQALQQTEQIINTIFSHYVGQPVDLGGGSRGYSRRCVEYLLAHSSPGPWDDAQWPMLLHQAGFAVNYMAVDGLDWESADRHRTQAADAVLQRTLADAYDADPKHWARRVGIAFDIIQAGLAAIQPASLPQTIYAVIDELRLLAAAGLHFAQTHHDQERYARVQAAAAQLAAVVEQRTAADFLTHFQGDLFAQRISPLSTVDAVVVRNERILLIKRHDNGLWALPGGLVEVNQRLTEAVLRELEEETGIQGRVVELLGIFDSQRWESQEKVHLHHTIFLVDGGEQQPQPTREATAVGFFGEDELPPLSPGHHTRVPFLFNVLRREVQVPYVD